MFKNLKLHLTKKPVCKNFYDLLGIEAESAARTLKDENSYTNSQTSYRSVKRKKITGKIVVISLKSIIMKTKKKFKKNKRNTIV